MTPELTRRFKSMREWSTDDWKRHWEKVGQRRDDAIELVKELIQTDEQTCNEFHSFVHRQSFRLRRGNGKLI
jgi:hypothetical protein